MKGFALLASVLAVSTLLIPTPNEYRKSPVEPVLIQFHETVWEIPAACDIQTDLIVYGCYVPNTKTIHISNPCYYPEAENVGSFAYTLCHEKGHVNGWRH